MVASFARKEIAWYNIGKPDELLRVASEVSHSCPAELPNVIINRCSSAAKGLMTILLQNKRTLRFVEGAAGWTPLIARARVFETGLQALFFCLNHHIANMQILGKFADRRMDFAVPVTDLRGD